MSITWSCWYCLSPRWMPGAAWSRCAGGMVSGWVGSWGGGGAHQCHGAYYRSTVPGAGPPHPGGALFFNKRTDRKSTRLNSSHTVISYAVFCLKEKKSEGVPYTAV